MRKKRLVFLCLTLALLSSCALDEPMVQTDGEAEITEEIKFVALTFDDGPHAGTTERLLDGLEERGVHATFFLIGSEIPGTEDLIRRMQEEGHQIGNHTWSHIRLAGPSSSQAEEEISKTDALLTSILGKGTYWLRPPYGQVAEGIEVRVPMVKWSVDPRDWETRNTSQVVRAIVEAVQPNSIILLHDIYQTSVDAALEVVDTLQKEGYCFVTVEELLANNDIVPEPGILYRTGTG